MGHLISSPVGNSYIRELPAGWQHALRIRSLTRSLLMPEKIPLTRRSSRAMVRLRVTMAVLRSRIMVSHLHSIRADTLLSNKAIHRRALHQASSEVHLKVRPGSMELLHHTGVATPLHSSIT